jgi:hypothetical protein
MGATHKMATQIKLRRDTAANWTSTNPVLALGEPGLEIDTRKIKYGDGTTAWTSLAYSAGDANFSGNYTDLSNKPTIPDAQIQSDWTQSDNALKDFIKNKPSIPAAQIQSDWTQATNTELDFIKNKPTLVTNLDSLSDVTITSASSGQVLKYNGTNWVNDTDSTGGGASTGNVTFDDITVQGVNQLNLSAGADFTANLAYVRVRSGDVASHIHVDTGNNEAYDLIVGDDAKFVQVSSTGNIIMSSYDSANTTSYVWNFGIDGNLKLPAGGDIVDSTGTSVLGGAGGIALTDLSIGTDNSASGGGGLSYANSTGVFTYTPPVIPTDIANLADATSLLSGGSSSSIANGTSNVSIATSNGNVTIAAVGNTTMTVTGTGANITGTLTSTGKIGYASGSTVTQTTNRGNGVNINALAGTIVTVSASMTAGEIGAFTVTNNLVDTDNDIVLVQVVSPNLGNYNVIANPNSGIGGFYVTLQNISGFPISPEAVTIRFMVIKAPNA